MGDDKINVFEPPKILQELGTDRKGSSWVYGC